MAGVVHILIILFELEESLHDACETIRAKTLVSSALAHIINLANVDLHYASNNTEFNSLMHLAFQHLRLII